MLIFAYQIFIFKKSNFTYKKTWTFVLHETIEEKFPSTGKLYFAEYTTFIAENNLQNFHAIYL